VIAVAHRQDWSTGSLIRRALQHATPGRA